jgi:C_GCAxxG_C_C family probable redox protein
LVNKSDKTQIAREYFLKGYNCSQSTAIPFCVEIGQDEKTVLKAMSGFGGGVARLREVCGAVSGITYICGMIDGEYNPSELDDKERVYKLIQAQIMKFQGRHKTINCGELLVIFDKNPMPTKRTEEYYKERPCLALVEDAAGFIADYINQRKESK